MKSKFIEGQSYEAGSVCDHNAKWVYKVIKRTAKSIWISEDGEEPKRKGISLTWDGHEMVKPHGTYSMAPILSADSPCEARAPRVTFMPEQACASAGAPETIPANFNPCKKPTFKMHGKTCYIARAEVFLDGEVLSWRCKASNGEFFIEPVWFVENMMAKPA